MQREIGEVRLKWSLIIAARARGALNIRDKHDATAVNSLHFILLIYEAAVCSCLPVSSLSVEPS